MVFAFRLVLRQECLLGLILQVFLEIRTKKGTPKGFLFDLRGGELGIRTPDTLVGYTHLAGERLRPLGQLSSCGLL